MKISVRLMITAMAYGLLGFMPYSHAGDNNRIGINGAACAFENIEEALVQAESGDIIFIKPGTYEMFVGKITTDLVFVPGDSAAPSFSGCETELLTAGSSSVIIDGDSATYDNEGGLGFISNGSTVLFRHMWLRNARANSGGIIAVLDGSHLILDDALVTDGVASVDGGNILAAEDSTIELINDSSIYRGISDGNGGAIALFSSELVMVDANIGVSSNNGFSQADNNGGGIYAKDSLLSLSSSQSKVIWNTAGKNGGGLYAEDSSVFMTDVFVNNNTTSISGGGLYLHNSVAEITESTFDGNSVSNFETNKGGGAMALFAGSSALLAETTVSNNTAENLGGGILIQDDSSVEITADSVISDNTAGSGGGVFNGNVVSINNSKVQANQALTGNGGGIQCFVCSEINILNNSLIADNQSVSGNGGGVSALFVQDTHQTRIENSQFLNNSASSKDDSEGYGGGLFIDAGTLRIQDSLFEDNSATYNGGGVFASKHSDASLVVDIDNTAFIANEVLEFMTNLGGGGAHFEGLENVKVTNSLFQSNASENLGGGILARGFSGAEIELENNVFDDNQAGSGGGISFSSAAGTIRVLNNTFTSNTRGAINFFGFNGTALIKKTLFRNNSTTRFGGALSIAFSDHIKLINSRFIDNSAGKSGGALSISSSVVDITSENGNGADQCNAFDLLENNYCSEFINNSAAENGGVISMAQAGSFISRVTIDKTSFLDNSAEMEGAVILINESDNQAFLTLENVLMAFNGLASIQNATIQVLGGHSVSMNAVTISDNLGRPMNIDGQNSNVSLNRSIIFNNTEGPFVAFGIPFLRSCNNSQTASIGGQSITGISSDPQFMATSRGDYRLSASSPSVDACADGPDFDLDGLFRPGNSNSYDQGAFERNGLQQDPDLIYADGFDR